MEPSKLLDLEKELTCSICTEILYQPLTLLDCLHTFCGSCLKEWFDHITTKARSAPASPGHGSPPSYTCPSCRSTVRDTGHNATVVTLLDMYLTANPDRGRTRDEKDELAKRYKPGDVLLPRSSPSGRRDRRRRGDPGSGGPANDNNNEADRLLLEEVRQMSLREAVQDARGRGGGGGVGRSGDASGDESGRDDYRTRQQQQQQQQQNHEQAEDRVTRERRRRNYDEGHDQLDHRVEHQTSLRSLISAGVTDMSERDIEREIEEFAKQIQEEGLLDGLDLDIIDLSRDDELSRRVTEAYRRRQRDRANRADREDRADRADRADRTDRTDRADRTDRVDRTDRADRADRARRPVTLSAGTNTSGSAPGALRVPSSRPPSFDSQQYSSDRARSRARYSGDANPRSASTTGRPASSTRNRPHSRSASDTGHADERPRASTVATSQHLEVYVPPPDDRRRRRNASSSRSSAAPAGPLQPAPRLQSHSQMDLSTPFQVCPTSSSSPPAAATAADQVSRPPVAGTAVGARSSSLPTVPTTATVTATATAPPAAVDPQPASTSNLSFASRAAGGASPPRSAEASRIQRSHRPADLSILNMTVPTSSSQGSPRRNPGQLYQEPIIACSSCRREHIEYELHYNCAVCDHGDWNLCLDCYRAGRGCQGWYGFGHAAWVKWERSRQAGDPASAASLSRPHVFTANRYVPPRATPGGAEGRRTLTHEDPRKRLESGNFCSRCLAWSNACWWRCDSCNDGDWGFCNSCVNQGRACTHPLLPMTYDPPLQLQQQQSTPPGSPGRGEGRPTAASVYTGPGAAVNGPFKPLIFHTRCDVCRGTIAPAHSRYHCFACIGGTGGPAPDAVARGDYNICTGCYDGLVARGLIGADNGPAGWRRCLRGHRMTVVAFRDGRVGQWRHTVREVVGGRALRVEPVKENAALQRWSWYGPGGHRVTRVVVRDDVATAVPAPLSTSSSPSPGYDSLPSQKPGFPPDGGIGARAAAAWAWYPARRGRQKQQGGSEKPESEGEEEEDDNVLWFPRGAEVTEIEDVNGEWWFGVYMGREGVFPAAYVRVVEGLPLQADTGVTR